MELEHHACVVGEHRVTRAMHCGATPSDARHARGHTACREDNERASDQQPSLCAFGVCATGGE